MKSAFKTSNYEKYYKDLVPYLKKEKSQKYFIIILSLLASIFFFIFAINPTLSTIAKLKKQITDAKFVEEKLSTKINNLSMLSQQYQNIQKDLPFIMDAVPEKAQVPNLVGQIQSLGQESSVQILNIQVSPVSLISAASSQSSSFAFEISGTSTYDNLERFIGELSNMQRVLSIMGVQASESTEGEGLDYIIKGRAFYKR